MSLRPDFSRKWTISKSDYSRASSPGWKPTHFVSLERKKKTVGSDAYRPLTSIKIRVVEDFKITVSVILIKPWLILLFLNVGGRKRKEKLQPKTMF